jgi:hypothetical protein
LVTGLRLTTVTNTVFNATYLEVARDLLAAWGISVDTLIDDRLGDDVFSVGTSWAPLAALSDMVNAIGYTGQGLKIELDRRGEFLRLEYDTTGIHGYLNRTLPNLASGEWDLSTGGDTTERAAALWAQLLKMQRRGATLDPLVWWRSFVRPLCGNKAFGQTGAPPQSWLFSQSKYNGAGNAIYKDGVVHWAAADFTDVTNVNIPIPDRLLRSLRGRGVDAELSRLSKFGCQFCGQELEVISSTIVRAAYAKCWPPTLINGWLAYTATAWLNHRPVTTSAVGVSLPPIPEQLWLRALANIKQGVEAEHTTMRGAWARLKPPILMAVKLAVNNYGGGLRGLSTLFRIQELTDLVDICDRWQARYDGAAIITWVFDDYHWPAIANEHLGEYGASLVREVCDQILSICGSTMPMEAEVMQTVWLCIWHKVHMDGTFVY